MRSELLSGHGNDMHYNVRQVSGKYLINECIIFSSENVSLAKRELFSSSRLSCLGGADTLKSRPGERRSYARPISDSLFVSHCKSVYQIGMFQHVRH